jgi:pyrophosphatase PpaX
MTRLTILFDLDGTLVDSVELILRSKQHAFESRGLPAPTDREWLKWLGTPLRNTFARYTDDADEVERFITAYRTFQLAHHDALLRPYPGVAEAVRDLHAAGHPLGIVTSKSVELSERGLSRVGLLDFMDTIVGADSTRRHKPDPEPVRVALERLKATPDRAVFVGDSVHDMHAGNAAGVGTVAALWGPFSRADLMPSQPRFFAERPGDLPDLVARLDGAPGPSGPGARQTPAGGAETGPPGRA